MTTVCIEVKGEISTISNISGCSMAYEIATWLSLALLEVGLK